MMEGKNPEHEVILSSGRLGENPDSDDDGGGFDKDEFGDNVAASTNYVENGHDETFEIPRDTFSFFAFGRVSSLPFLLSVFVFCIQFGIYILALWNLLDDNNTRNGFKVPVYVSDQVRAAQGIAIFLTAATLIPDANNTVYITSVKKEDLDRNARRSEALYSSSHFKFHLTMAIRFVETFGAAATSFVLIVQSSAVIDLFFNFAALTFISELDVVAFVIARSGFLGLSSSITEMAQTVENSKASVRRKSLQLKLWFSRIYVVVLFVVMLSLWGVICVRQETAVYDCQSLSIQIGDDFEESCGLLSGTYDFETRDRSTGYPEYRNENAEVTLSYDNGAKTWIFEGVRCVVYSSETEEYDVVKVPSSVTWNVYDAYEEYHGGLLYQFSLTCNDCDLQEGSDDEDSRDYLKQCSGKGECNTETRKCDCTDSYNGPLCEIYSPAKWCEILEDNEGKTWEYVIVREEPTRASQYVMVFGRPVYFGYTTKSYGKFIIFLGRRYILGNVTHFFNVTSYGDLVDFFKGSEWQQEAQFIWGENRSSEEASAHAKELFDGIELISEPADVGTKNYQNPVDQLSWYEPYGGSYWLGLRPDIANVSSTRFTCIPHCNTSNFQDEYWGTNDDYVEYSCNDTDWYGQVVTELQENMVYNTTSERWVESRNGTSTARDGNIF